jgi:hypothetical protein
LQVTVSGQTYCLEAVVGASIVKVLGCNPGLSSQNWSYDSVNSRWESELTTGADNYCMSLEAGTGGAVNAILTICATDVKQEFTNVSQGGGGVSLKSNWKTTCIKADQGTSNVSAVVCDGSAQQVFFQP